MVVRNTLYGIIALAVVSLACKESLVGESPENTYMENFNSLWRGFDANYSYFEHKELNWDSLYTVYLVEMERVDSDEELFNVMSSLVARLRDGHATLITPEITYRYTGWRDTRFDPNHTFGYLRNIKYPDLNSPFLYGTIGERIAYLRIKEFSGSETKYKLIDDILKELDTEQSYGLILDVRTNGGGSDINAHIVGSRFADQKRLIRRIRYRNGPEHSDFSPVIDDFLSPNGFHYNKNVVILTDGSVYSAAEDFVLAMRQFPRVHVVGERTGGGSGNPITMDLPNGWLYTVPRWQILQPEDNQLYEVTGLKPDSLVYQTSSFEALNRDAHLEAAANLLIELYVNEL